MTAKLRIVTTTDLSQTNGDFFLILFLEITRITKVDTFWFSFYAFYHAARVEVYSHGFCEPVR